MPIAFDDQGLIPALAQDRLTGEVRMVAWMNREALGKTLETGLATFYSRSRGRLWQKGESSGHVLRVARVVADCDADTLLLLVDPDGPSCHTGRPSCFFRSIRADGELDETPVPATPFLLELEQILEQRRTSTAEKSYTRSLLDGGPERIAAKIREEADELCRALESESDERVASEAADLLYHALVGLRLRGVAFRSVLDVLAKRAGTSGHAEKAARSGG